jgi:hypothetical protein
MLDAEWDDGFKIVEVIEMTGPVEKVVCSIGTWLPENKVVHLETYRSDELVNEETFGFGPTLPMAELVSDLEEGLRNDAQATGAQVTIFRIPAPFGRAQFEEVVAARRAAHRPRP